MIRRVLILAALAVALAAPARATASVDARERALEHRLMCPTCHQLLALSHSPVAERMRRHIRLRLAAGASPAVIEHELVDEFGPAVLAEPPARGFGLLAWLVPAAGLAAAAAAVAGLALAWRRRTQHDDAAVASVSPALLRRLERELAAFDD